MERGRFNPDPRAQGSGYGRGQRFGTHSGVSGILLPLLSCALYMEVGFQGRLELFDDAASSVVLMEFDGVHFPKNGSFYAFAQEEGGDAPVRARDFRSYWNLDCQATEDDIDECLDY